MKLVYFLEGKKTFIVAIVIAVLNLAVALNWITPDHLAQINMILGAAGLGAIRDSISKV